MRVNRTFDVEYVDEVLGELVAEVRLNGSYWPGDMHGPEEFPEAEVESLTLYDEDAEPYDGDLKLLDRKVNSYQTLADLLCEKALEAWKDEDRDE